MRKRHRLIRRAAIESLERRLCLSAVNVTTHHGDASNDGANLQETVLTPADVTPTTFGKQWTAQLDGGVVTAQPTYLENVNITAGTSTGIHSVVYVGTEADGLYAIDANTGAVLWHDSFLDTTDPTNLTPTAGVGPIRSTDINGNVDVGNNIGIVATPAFDTSINEMFVTTNTREVRGTDTHFVQRLWAINCSSGASVMAPAVIGDTIADAGILGNFTYVSGPIINGTGNNNPANPNAPTYPNTDRWLSAPNADTGSVIAFNAILQMERPAVTLLNGNLYLAFASHGDDGPYYGWVLGYKESNLALMAVFNAIPTFSTNVDSSQPYIAEAGIWMSGANIATDGTNLYVTTGNGAFNGSAGNFNSSGFPLDHDYGDSIIKLALDASSTQTSQNGNGWGLKVADYFTPSNQYELNAIDLDLGSGGVTLLPNNLLDAAGNPMLMVGGKESRIYLLDRNNLGKFNPAYTPETSTTLDPRSYDNVLGEYVYTGGVDVGGKQVYSSGTYLNGNVYFGLDGAPGLEFSVANFASGTTPPGATYVPPVTKTTVSLGYPGATWQATANGTSNGIIWGINPSGADLLAYNASSFVNPIYDSNTNGSDNITGGTVKFELPLIVNGMAYVGTQNGTLIGYGLDTSYLTTTTFNTPTGLSAAMASATDAHLTWTSNSPAAAEFLVTRSTDGVNFTTVGYAPNSGNSAMAYDDTTVPPNTRYYYRVAAVSGGSKTSASSAALYLPSFVLPTTASIYLRVDPDLAHLDAFTNSTGQGTPAASAMLSQIGGVTVSPSTGSLMIDYSNGSPVPSGVLSYSPSAAGTLSILGASATVNVFSDHLTLAGTGYSSQINFSLAVTSVVYSGTTAGSAITQSAQPAGGSFQVGTFQPADTLTVSAGTYTFVDPGYGNAPSWRFNSLSIGIATVVVNPSTDPTDRGILGVYTLAMTGGATPNGRLDLGHNDLLVGSPAFSPALVADGSNLDRWDGNGITSSAAAGDTTHLTALGVFQVQTAGTFNNNVVTAGEWVVNYTLVADANLNWKVDGSDYSLIDAGYAADVNHPGSATGWSSGDFNYDGTIDGSDYALIDNTYNNQAVALQAHLQVRPVLQAQTFVADEVTFTLLDQFGNLLPTSAGSALVTVATTSATGHFSGYVNGPVVTSITSQAGYYGPYLFYEDSSPTKATLTGTAANVAGGSAVVAPLPPAGVTTSIGLTSQTSAPSVGSAVSLNVGLLDALGGTGRDTTMPTVVNLTSSSPSGYFYTSFSPLVTSVSTNTGSSGGPTYFYYVDTTPGTPTITATTAGFGSATYQLNIAGPLAAVAISTPARSPNVNVPSSPITLQLTDASGNPVTSTSAVTINLSSTASTGTFLNSSFGSITSVTVPAGSSAVTVEYKDTVSGTPTISAASSGLTGATQQQTVSTAYLLPSGTVAFYSFENPANLFADTSGNGHALAVATGLVAFDPGAAAGHNGSALFPGGGSLQTSTGAFPTGVPTGSSAYTIAAWIDVTGLQKNGIVGWGNWGTNNQVNAFRTTQGDGTAPDGYGLDNYWWGNDQIVTTPNDLLDNWAYVAVTSTGSAQTIYVNGVSVGTAARTGQDAVASNFRVGTTNNSTEFFTGRMSDLLIANVAFSQTQIQTLYGQV